MSSREDRRADLIEWSRDLLIPGWDEREDWHADCPHLEVCDSLHECLTRHPHCACVVIHEREVECLAWQRENPPNIDREGD